MTGFVEWVSTNHVVTNNGRLLQILCILLQDDAFQLPAAECLLQIVNRKGSVSIANLFIKYKYINYERLTLVSVLAWSTKFGIVIISNYFYRTPFSIGDYKWTLHFIYFRRKSENH